MNKIKRSIKMENTKEDEQALMLIEKKIICL